jgi:hypothetical protein
MPKSEFDDQLTVKGGRITVSGVVDADTDAVSRQSGAPVEVLWVIAQGNLVAHGHVHADGTKFADEDNVAQAWKAGAAQVSGVTVTVNKRHKPVQLEAFEWHQEVELKLG